MYIYIHVHICIRGVRNSKIRIKFECFLIFEFESNSTDGIRRFEYRFGYSLKICYRFKVDV